MGDYDQETSNDLIKSFKLKLDEFKELKKMEDIHLLSQILNPCMHFISTEVMFADIKTHLIPLLPGSVIQQAECCSGSSASMCYVCDYVKRLTLPEFVSFIEALTKDHLHVAEKLMDSLEQSLEKSKTTPISSHSSQPSLPLSQSQRFQRIPPGSANNPVYPQHRSLVANHVGMRMHQTLASTRNFSSTSTSHCVLNVNGGRGPLLPNSSTSQMVFANRGSVSATGGRLQFNQPFTTDHRHLSTARVQTPQVSSSQASNIYQMTSHPRGLALIINNENFQNLNLRQGSSVDAVNLDNLFSFLGFRVSIEKNKTAKEMLEILKGFSQQDSLGCVSSLAVAILTHGGENERLFGVDGQVHDGSAVAGTFITKSNIIQMFSGSSCRIMTGRPKLFILQACRGNEENSIEEDNPSSSGPPVSSYTHGEQQGLQQLEQSDLGERSMAFKPSNMSSCMTLNSDPNNNINSASIATDPSEMLSSQRHDFLSSSSRGGGADTADMCFIHASSYGYKAYRMRDDGSPFIQVFTETVKRLARQEEFRDIIQDIQKQFNAGPLPNKMMTLPDFSVQLMKKWFLNPPS